jgi:hypothetical protein
VTGSKSGWRAPGWYLALYVLVNCSLATTWFVLHLGSGHTGWAVFFGALDALAVAIVLWAIVIKRRRRREAGEFRESTAEHES